LPEKELPGRLASSSFHLPALSADKSSIREWNRAVFPAQIGTDQERQADRWADPSALAEIETIPVEALRPDSLDPETWMLGAMAGRSLAMQHLFSRMKSTAPHFRLATVEGEPGTGKLLAAQTLHRLGPASAGPFAPYVAADFLENPQACWKEARQGLLWLSRVDELSPEQQRGLRDFLERAAHERIRLGATQGPLQLVAGASQPLRRLAATGGFRSDLAGHLTAIRFTLPALRDRRDDIPLLAAIFLRRWMKENDRILRGFAPGTLGRLTAHEWPGNVRELESVISAAAMECPGQWIRPVDLPRLAWPAATAAAAVVVDPAMEDPNLDRAILRHITRVLARCSGNKVRAARSLGISRSTLYRLLESGEARPE
jgi:DNA-binding NtrC family response regulator